MAKKSFESGLDSLISGSSIPKNRIQTLEDNLKNVTQEQTPEDNTRRRENRSGKNTSRMGVRDGALKITFIIDEDICNKMRSLAYFDREPIGEMVEQIFKDYLSKRDPKVLREAIQAYNKSSA